MNTATVPPFVRCLLVGGPWNGSIILVPPPRSERWSAAPDTLGMGDGDPTHHVTYVRDPEADDGSDLRTYRVQEGIAP